jgi:hypothetical protein
MTVMLTVYCLFTAVYDLGITVYCLFTAAYDLGGVVTNARREGEEIIRTKKLGHLKEVHW